MKHRLIVPRWTTDFTPTRAPEPERAPRTRARLLIAANLVRAIGNAIGSLPVELYPPGVRVKAPFDPRILEPDAAIARLPVDFERQGDASLLNPIVIFGVLSGDSEALYRGELFHGYAAIPSLGEIVLISSALASIERFERRAEGRWATTMAGAGEATSIREIGLDLPVDEVYRRVSFAP